MFVIMELLTRSDILGFKSDPERLTGHLVDCGGHILFDSEKDANDFAVKNCSFKWKIIEL